MAGISISRRHRNFDDFSINTLRNNTRFIKPLIVSNPPTKISLNTKWPSDVTVECVFLLFKRSQSSDLCNITFRQIQVV